MKKIAFLIGVFSILSGCAAVSVGHRVDNEKTQLAKENTFYLTSYQVSGRNKAGTTGKLQVNYAAEKAAIENIDIDSIAQIISEKYGIKIDTDKIKKEAKIEYRTMGLTTPAGWYCELQNTQEKNRVDIEYIYEASPSELIIYYVIAITSDGNEIIRHADKLHDEDSISAEWSNLAPYAKKMPEKLKKDLNKPLDEI
ncbi:MAG: hypothetical protein A2Y41_12790 [Spirochaetes bacterium GWB1_36_13]|nr:MAG: hypothetical protein A2Y41_12790 [Spirochaetes bacterium GWB1_36_13]